MVAAHKIDKYYNNGTQTPTIICIKGGNTHSSNVGLVTQPSLPSTNQSNNV